MDDDDAARQLELFELQPGAPPRIRRETLGRIQVHLRHDQAMLSAIAGVLVMTVVFACGVERGKTLVRAERLLAVRQQRASPEPAPVRETAPAAAPATVEPATRAPAVVPKPKPVTKVAAEPTPSGSRYAVQVVTFSRPQRAKQEMDRLRARGERAFLVMRDGRTIVYVGPFPSKGNARQKLSALKTQYSDCFVRTL